MSNNKVLSDCVAYAVICNDENIRKQSSSGGVFSILAKEVIDEGGVVFGAAFDDNLEVLHIQVESVDDLYKLRGSKYVQSKIGDAYKNAEEILKSGKLVLFSGTPCQIAGLKAYLKTDYDNLLTQDIVCHGTPKPEIWKMYIEYLERKYDSKIDKNEPPRFRDKALGWTKFSMKVKLENGNVYRKSLAEDFYMKAFLANLSLRKPCFNCAFKTLNRSSDITLADFWGVDKILPEFFDNNGTSLVLINSEKGMNLFNKISDKIRYKETDINKAVQYNSPAVKSAFENPNYDKFMSEISAKDFPKVVNKYTRKKLSIRIKIKIKNVIKRMCK